MQVEHGIGPLLIRLEVVAHADLCIEEFGDEAAVEQLHLRFLERAIQRLLALALEEELVVVGADPALGITGIGMLASVAPAIFVLVELEVGYDLGDQLGAASGRSKNGPSAA